MPRDDYWRLGGVVIGGHPGPEQTRTLGENVTLDVWLTARSDSESGEWPDYVERFRTLRQYQNFAGAFALHELSSGRVAFTETHAASSELPGGTLLVALRPPTDTDIGQGGWFVVSACEDSTTLPSALCQLDFELTFVAPLDAYQNTEGARRALESDGI
jgi:hypothetical protein